MERFHGLELLVGIGQGIASVGLDQILPETEAAAVSAFRIVHHAASQGLYKPGQDTRVFGTADRLGGEDLGVVAAYVLDYFQRLPGMYVYQRIPGLLRYQEAVVVHHVAGVHQEVRLGKLPFTGFPEQFVYFAGESRYADRRR